VPHAVQRVLSDRNNCTVKGAISTIRERNLMLIRWATLILQRVYYISSIIVEACHEMYCYQFG